MRTAPELWKGAGRIQWGCTLMEILGEPSLENLPTLLSGLRSIESIRHIAPFRTAVRTTRTLLGDILTRRAIQNAVFDLLDAPEGVRSYEVDPQTLTFRVRSEYDPRVAEAKSILSKGLPHQSEDRRLADASKDLSVRLDEDRRLMVRMRGLRLPAPERHDIARRPRGAIDVQWTELAALARELDREDELAGRPLEDWAARVARIELEVTTGSGLAASGCLRLEGLKHLIGLPGSGKTTLITLLCVLLARRGLRTVVFFTSIETARQYLDRLRRYTVRTAILVGRTAETHLRHANRLAELVAAQGDGGFARTLEGVDLFAQSCALPAFADQWPTEWQLGEAPCEHLFEAESKVERLCPAWQLCGRVKNQRELVHARVWLGHILSADTPVPGHTSSERIRFFELAAKTFDLVVIDECDEAQKALDKHGALTLTLTGNTDSVHTKLQRVTGVLAANKRKVSETLFAHIVIANEFEKRMLWFVAEVRRLQREHGKSARRHAEKLLSANFLLREAIRAAGGREKSSGDFLTALSDFWETAMYSAYFEHGEANPDWRKAPKYASVLGLTMDEAQQRWRRLNRALRRYLALDHAAATREPIDDVRTVFAELIAPARAADIEPHVRLLVAAAFTIAAYQRLARHARPLARIGEIPEELVFSRASSELRESVPRSVLGTFSSVRFRRAPSGDGLEIDYLVMDCTPRVVLHRLHELDGGSSASVLLASATSWLEPSSEYHVDKKPDYVLRPRGAVPAPVRLYFRPKKDPVGGLPLRFSGAGADAEENLLRMVTALAAPLPAGRSDIERSIRAMKTPQPHQRPRKVALVVNSYEQVRLVVEQLRKVNPELSGRTRGVVRSLPEDDSRGRYVLRGQFEGVGADLDVDVLVFPIGALGRGVNLVFKTGDEDEGRAAVGTILFLTRPHPAAGDLGLLTSLLARSTERLDARDLSEATLEEASRICQAERYRVYGQVSRLLARPMSASQLDPDTLKTFAANLIVPVLQTIGRAMRKSMPVEVYFVDAAWARNSAEGKPETTRSSVLVNMRAILEECLAKRDADERQVYEALYGPFVDAFRQVDGVIYPDGTAPDDLDEPLKANPWALEDAGDMENFADGEETDPSGAGGPTDADGDGDQEETTLGA